MFCVNKITHQFSPSFCRTVQHQINGNTTQISSQPLKFQNKFLDNNQITLITITPHHKLRGRK